MIGTAAREGLARNHVTNSSPATSPNCTDRKIRVGGACRAAITASTPVATRLT